MTHRRLNRLQRIVRRLRPRGHIDWLGFWSNMLSVILGIFITFTIQGIIDRKEEKAAVDAALQLAQQELTKDRADLQAVADIMRHEQEAAVFFWQHQHELDKFSDDSLAYHSGFIFMEMMVQTTDAALELLKTSTLFPSINDNAVAMDIINAYDKTAILTSAFRVHEQKKMDLIHQAVDSDIKSRILTHGAVSMQEFMQTASGRYVIYSLLSMADPRQLTEGFPDLDKSIESIKTYLAQ